MTEVVAALIWQGDKFMICQRPAHKARGLLWVFVGGKAEPEETKEQALIVNAGKNLLLRYPWTMYLWMLFMDITI